MEWFQILLVAVFLVGAFAFAFRFLRRRLKLPPGPRGLPLVGNMFQFPQFFSDGDSVSQLVQRFGPIVSLSVGSVPIVIVASREAAYHALVERGAAFASRPQRPAGSPRSLLSSGCRTINASPYGPHWASVRRNLTATVAGASRFAAVRRTAVARLVADVAAGGTIPAVRKHLRFATFTILSYMCFGEWLQDDTIAELEELMRETLRLNARAEMRQVVASISPALEWLLLHGWNNSGDEAIREFLTRRRHFFKPLLHRARERCDAGELDPQCYVATLLQMKELSYEDIVALVSEFHNAGADTTAVTLEWALACLVNHPDIQQKLYDEIRSRVGDEEREIDEGDLRDMSYLRAVVKETLRVHPPGYSTLPHTVQEQCKLYSYDIPANALVFFHIFTMANDPEVWPEPGKFRPERFLSESKVPALSFAPFGAGRRICPGASLAETHLHLILARLVQAFEWSSRDGDQVDMTPRFEFTVLMKSPLAPVVRARSSLKFE